jgi:hypothetical protein
MLSADIKATRSRERDRVQAVVFAYEHGLVHPGQLGQAS